MTGETGEQKPNFLRRVGIARLIALIVLLIAVIMVTYFIKPKQMHAPNQLTLPPSPSTAEIAIGTKESITAQMEQRKYCEEDSDCEAFYGECPFGCRIGLNKQFVEPAKQLISTRRTNEEKQGNPMCVYGCTQLLGVQCKEQKCKTQGWTPREPSREENYVTANLEDLERYRISPNDTTAELEQRRTTVDQRMNGEYAGCTLSSDGRFVLCT